MTELAGMFYIYVCINLACIAHVNTCIMHLIFPSRSIAVHRNAKLPRSRMIEDIRDWKKLEVLYLIQKSQPQRRISSICGIRRWKGMNHACLRWHRVTATDPLRTRRLRISQEIFRGKKKFAILIHINTQTYIFKIILS